MARLLLHFHGRWMPALSVKSGHLPWNDHGSRLFAEILAAVVRRGHGYELLLSRDPGALAGAWGTRGFDGVLTNVGYPGAPWVKRARWVMVGGDVPSRGIAQVCLPEGQSMEKVVGHLRALGHRRIGWASIHPPGRRLSAFRQVMEEHGKPPEAAHIFQPAAAVLARGCKIELRRFLRDACLGDGHPMDAVVCDNDATARFLMALAKDEGISVPDTLGVTGVDGRPDIPGLPRLTTLVQEPRLLARASVRLLEDLMAGRRRETQAVYLEAGLRFGETTAPRVSPPAERLPGFETSIESHYLSADPAASIARDLGLHRAYFLRRFAHLMGTPFPKVLAGKRLARARDLLQKTTLPVGQVASECGYESMASFHRLFMKAFGETPGECRASGGPTG